MSQRTISDNRIVEIAFSKETAIRILAIVTALGIWQLISYTQPAYIFPPIVDVVEAFQVQIAEEGLIEKFARSMATLFLGFGIATFVGIGVGLSMGLNENVETMLDPYISAIYVAPIAALIPIILLVGGQTFESRVFIVFLFAVFEVTLNTHKGVQTVPENLRNVARSFNASRTYTVRNVVIPHTFPYAFTGMRLGLGRGIKGLIVAELLIEFTNLGFLIHTWAQSYRVAGVFSVVLLVMVTGIVLIGILKMIESRLIQWK